MAERKLLAFFAAYFVGCIALLVVLVVFDA
jgi:hypothetical protein